MQGSLSRSIPGEDTIDNKYGDWISSIENGYFSKP
jgi:hypothetical protein